jgi:hypothetical protein
MRRIKQFLFLLLAGLLATAMWLWVQRIAIPHQQAESAELGTPRGNLSDLYPRWLGARELLLHHRDPYSPSVTREIQAGYYGRPLDPTRPHDPKDQQAFAYPVYVIFLLAPTVGLPFLAVQKLFFWLFVIQTAASVFLWMDALDWRPSFFTIAIWIVLTLSCFPAIQGIKLQQLSLFVAFLLAAFASLLARRQFVWAGGLLALATIKPQLAALPVLWLGIWALGDWKRRQRIVWSFAITMSFLVVGGELLLPGWIGEFRVALSAYYQYTGGGNSVLDVALSPVIGRVLAAVLVCAFLVLSWQLRRFPERSPDFQWSLSLSLAVTLAVIPMFAPYNQVLLLPALMMIVRSLVETWKKGTLPRFFVVLTAIAVFEQWITAALLVIARLFLPAATVQKLWDLPFYPSLAIPITVLALLLITRGHLLQRPHPALD